MSETALQLNIAPTAVKTETLVAKQNIVPDLIPVFTETELNARTLDSRWSLPSSDIGGGNDKNDITQIAESKPEASAGAAENSVEEGNDERKELLDTKDLMAEFIRAIIIMIALVKLANQKDLYSGSDLNLPFMPPEGESNDILNKALFGQTSTDSWKNFVTEVEKIQNVKYDNFVALVMFAHERNNKDGIKLKKPEGKTNKLSQRGENTVRKVPQTPKTAVRKN